VSRSPLQRKPKADIRWTRLPRLMPPRGHLSVVAPWPRMDRRKTPSSALRDLMNMAAFGYARPRAGTCGAKT